MIGQIQGGGLWIGSFLYHVGQVLLVPERRMVFDLGAWANPNGDVLCPGLCGW